jgi:hypothetical protein
MRNKIWLSAVLCLFAAPAFAGEPCQSAKNIVKVAKSFYGDNPELTNIVTPKFTLALKGINGAADPTAIRYRYEGVEDTLPIVNGRLEDFETVAGWSKDGEICRLIDGELAPVTEGDSTEASMNFFFPYKRTDGVFTIDEIREGAKDGSKVMSSLAPGGLGFVVPGLKALDIRPETIGRAVPAIAFTRNGTVVDVDIYPYQDQRLIRLKDIKKSKADTLTITGSYRAFAAFKFDPDKIAKAEAARTAKAATTEN